LLCAPFVAAKGNKRATSNQLECPLELWPDKSLALTVNPVMEHYSGRAEIHSFFSTPLEDPR
jgi:hypothetical protein